MGVAILLFLVSAGIILTVGTGEDEEARQGEEGAIEGPPDGEASPEEDTSEDGPSVEGSPEAEEDRPEAGREPRELQDPIELDERGRPDRTVPDDETISPPDLSRLDVAESRVAELLLDIEASERVMLGFQLDVRELFAGGVDPEDADELLASLEAVAARGADALATLRERLEEPQEAVRAEEVRETYLVHLDSWIRYMVTVEDDPQILLRDTSPYTVDINRTADLFVRAVDELLDTADLDRELRRYAEAIVARGFPDAEDSQV